MSPRLHLHSIVHGLFSMGYCPVPTSLVQVGSLCQLRRLLRVLIKPASIADNPVQYSGGMYISFSLDAGFNLTPH